MFYVYILHSVSSDHYYIGHTNDVEKRLKEHNNPKENSKFTSKHLPWELKLWFEVTQFREDAMKVERFIKNQKSREFIERIISEVNNQYFFADLVKNILKR